MREFKIFLVVACFTALTYWGVEPYAHSVMKPHVAPANFDFEQEDINFAKKILAEKEKALELAKAENNETNVESANKALELAKENLAKQEALWASVAKIDFNSGNASEGKAFFETNCVACHGAKFDGIEGAITDSSLGVLPPDLSSAGLIYDEKFLAALIMNPALALKVDHKFGDAFLMTPYNAEVSGENEDVANANIANVIAYLKEIGIKYQEDFENKTKALLDEKYAKLTELDEGTKKVLWQKDFEFAKDKNNFIEACGRCHDMKYDSFTAVSAKNDLKAYLGSNPPDLSMMIRSRGDEYLHNFINNTQKLLVGTAMPRVGITEEAQASVVAYLEKVGDSKKEERESLGLYIMGFFVILSIFAIAWKRKIWSKLH
ncbi:cytochrome C [Campylobacter sp. MIT 99-7217]|uniref:c-type cytochrome n=1 Tax=Campylobacter sp. MIT 99-7217 TaxID=535091 RepID=UPI00115A0B12|nr:c-type cytochrome [Campylobacter sp. MIT 99-7217]TQR30933.1 cytochrome C [Campylobacter sp. MIT 99-7217]